MSNTTTNQERRRNQNILTISCTRNTRLAARDRRRISNKLACTHKYKYLRRELHTHTLTRKTRVQTNIHYDKHKHTHTHTRAARGIVGHLKAHAIRRRQRGALAFVRAIFRSRRARAFLFCVAVWRCATAATAAAALDRTRFCMGV